MLNSKSKWLFFVIGLSTSISCSSEFSGSNGFAGSSGPNRNSPPPSQNQTPKIPPPTGGGTPTPPGLQPPGSPPIPLPNGGTGYQCSQQYRIPGTSNLYLAGVSPQATLNYNFEKFCKPDTVANAAPQEIAILDPRCLAPGSQLVFDVNGSISNSSATGLMLPDGGAITQHKLGSQLGKSSIRAPYNSLVAVFLDEGDPSMKMPPPSLTFESEEARNYLELRPMVRQVFFIGDGKTRDGRPQVVVVPPGTTRVFFGTMDSGQWCNNQGQLQGAILWKQ